MRIYKELDGLGFFEWYCTQYGGLNYTEYKEVYDQLPLDNIIRTELNACVFKFFRDTYNLDVRIAKDSHKIYHFQIDTNFYGNWILPIFDRNYDKGELECIEKLIGIAKERKNEP